MMKFTTDECNLMMLYSPGTRQGLIEALKQMKEQLTAEEKELSALAESVLKKLAYITDTDFKQLNLYPDF